MPRSTLAVLVCAASPTLSCKAPEAAPKDLDGLVHYFWDGYEGAEDADLADAAANLMAATDGRTRTEVLDGTISALDAGQVAAVGIEGQAAADAQGVFLVNVFACGLSRLEELLLAKDQDVLYEGVYDRYSRTYTSSRAEYESREVTTMRWDVEYDATILGASYTAWMDGGLRAVPGQGEDASPWGEFIVQRTFMARPAAFENDGKSLEQDYQIEVYIERSPGEILHVYGLWREADFGAGFTSEDEGVQTIMLNNMKGWDDDTAALCALD